MKLKTLISIIVLSLCWAFVLFMLSGCHQIKASKIADAADDVVSITPVMCETAEYFSVQGVDIPGIENCEKLIQFLDKKEVIAAIKIVECTREYRNDKDNLTSCAMDAGWPLIKNKLNFLDGTDFEGGGTTNIDIGGTGEEGYDKQ